MIRSSSRSPPTLFRGIGNSPNQTSNELEAAAVQITRNKPGDFDGSEKTFSPHTVTRSHVQLLFVPES